MSTPLLHHVGLTAVILGPETPWAGGSFGPGGHAVSPHPQGQRQEMEGRGGRGSLQTPVVEAEQVGGREVVTSDWSGGQEITPHATHGLPAGQPCFRSLMNLPPKLENDHT